MRTDARTIDIHAHMHVEAAEALMRPHVTPDKIPILRFTSSATRAANARALPVATRKAAGTRERLADMDAQGVDVQVLSPTPVQYYYWAEPELGRDAARLVNDAIAAAVSARPERFAGLGSVPLQDVRLAVEELQRCMGELGLRGVEIDTSANGRELSDPALLSFWQAAEDLGALVFIHPLGFTHGERLREHYLMNVIGNPLESALAIAHLIFDGVLDAHPALTICVAHGGGYLPAYPGRMAHAYAVRDDCRGCKEPPDTYLRRLYYDSVVHDPGQLAQLVARYGSEHVLLGSDWPYDMGQPHPVAFIESAPALSDADRRNVCGANAERLLGIAAVTS